jgi:single-stranded DNA-binding protein
MGNTARAIELMEQAITLLREPAQPTPIRQSQQPAENELSFTGTISRPDFKQVGNQGIALFTASLEIRREIDAKKDWLKIQAWRSVAAWAGNNLIEGSVITVKGKFETSEWINQKGETQTKTIFSVRAFQAA